MIQKKKKTFPAIGRIGLAVGIAMAAGGAVAAPLALNRTGTSPTTKTPARELLSNQTFQTTAKQDTGGATMPNQIDENAVKNFAVDQTKAQSAIDAYEKVMDDAYKGQHAITPPEVGVSDKLTAPGSYMPFLDIGLMYWSTAQGVADTFKDGAQNLYYGSFLTAPNRGFKSESGSKESWASTALLTTMDQLNYNITTAGPKDSSKATFDIPVAYAGAFAYDFAAAIEVAGTPLNVFDEVRKNHGDIMFSIGGWRSNSFATTVAIAQDKVGNNTKFNEYYLAAIYAYIIDKLHLNALDFDIEGTAVPGSTNPSTGGVLSNDPNAPGQAPAPTPEESMHGLQMNLLALKILKSIDKYKPVKISFTLPVVTTGFKQDFIYEMVRTALNENLIYRNYLMVMDYDGTQRRTIPGEMAMAAISAVNGVAQRLREDPLYNADTDPSLVYRRLGIIPMLGKNDVAYQVFTLTDAKVLTNWSIANGVSSIAPWSYNKDIEEKHIGNADEFASGWTGDMAGSFDKAEFQKSGTDKKITGKNTLLNTKYHSFDAIFAHLAARTPIPNAEINVSSDLKELLAAFGFTNGLSDLYASVTPFHTEQKKTGLTVQTLDAIYRDEYAFYDDYIKTGTTASAGGHDGLPLAVRTARANSSLSERVAKYDLFNGTDVNRGGNDPGTGTPVGSSNIPKDTIVWYKNRWYKALTTIWAPLGDKTNTHNPDNASGEWQLLAASDDKLSTLDIAVAQAKAAKPDSAMDSDAQKNAKWGLKPKGTAVQFDAGNKYLAIGQVVWYEDSNDPSQYSGKWYQIDAAATIEANGDNGWTPNVNTVGPGKFLPVSVTDPAKVDQAAAKITDADGEKNNVHWKADFVSNGLINNVSVASPDEMLAVLDQAASPKTTALLNAIKADGTDIKVELQPKTSTPDADGQYEVAVRAQYFGLPVDIHFPVTFTNTVDSTTTADDQNVSGVDLTALANKNAFLSSAQVLGGSVADLVSLGAVIPASVTTDYNISVSYVKQPTDGTFRASLVLQKKNQPAIIHTLAAPTTAVFKWIDDAVEPSPSLAAKLAKNPLAVLIEVSDFQITGTNEYTITTVKYLPPVAGAKHGTALVTIRNKTTGKDYAVLKDLEFTAPSLVNVNKSTNTSSKDANGNLTTVDDRLKALKQSGYNTDDQAALSAQTGLSADEVNAISAADPDQNAVDSVKAELAKVTSTTLEQVAFTNKTISPTTNNYTAQVAADLGMTRPNIPTDVTVTVTKNSGGAVLNFVITKGTGTSPASANIDVTVVTFGTNQDAKDVDTAVAALSNIDTTSKTEAAFTAKTVAAGTTLDAATASDLGITLPTLPSGVTVKVQKNSGKSLSFTVSKGSESKTASATISRFAVDPDEALVDQAVAALAAIKSTTLSEQDFKNVVVAVGTNFDATAAGTLGFTMPNLPSGVTVKVTKAANEATASFTVEAADGTPTKTAQATVTRFKAVPAEDAKIAQVKLVLGAITTSTKTETDFKSLVVLKTDFNPAAAALLGINPPNLPTDTQVQVAKEANSDSVSYTITNGSTTEGYNVPFVNFQAPSAGSSSSDNLAAIIGGSVGGGVGLAAVAGLTTYLVLRKKRLNK